MPRPTACVCLLLLSLAACRPLAASSNETPDYPSEAGIGFIRTQSIIRGGQMSTSVMPYLIHEQGPFFARIDTFGIRATKLGYGHLEVLGRYRGDGYSLSGLASRDNPVPVGLGTLQITPWGAFEATVLRDFGDSAGLIAQARYIARGTLWRLSVYPEFGIEHLDHRYTRHYYGTQALDALSLGREYTAGSANNIFLGLLASIRLSERIAFNAYIRRTWYGDSIKESPLVSRGARNSFFLALARAF